MMELHTLVLLMKMGISRGMVFTHFQMAPNSTDCGLMVNAMGQVLKFGPTALNMLATGKMGNAVVLAQ